MLGYLNGAKWVAMGLELSKWASLASAGVGLLGAVLLDDDLSFAKVVIWSSELPEARDGAPRW